MTAVYPETPNIGPHDSHPPQWVHCECGWFDVEFYNDRCGDTDCDSHVKGYVHYHARDNAAYVVHFPDRTGGA